MRHGRWFLVGEDSNPTVFLVTYFEGLFKNAQPKNENPAGMGGERQRF